MPASSVRTDPTDLARTAETLEMLAPRWSAWVLMTLASEPLRYATIKLRLPWLADGQLHPRLKKLTDAGVVQRSEYPQRHVSYGLTARGAELLPILGVLAAWGNAHLEKEWVRDATGARRPQQVAAAEDIEDTLALISPRHTTAIVWTLRARGAASATTVAAEAIPGKALTAVYPPLNRLVADGLVTAEDGEFRLSESGVDLAPVYRAVSAWAAGRPLGDTHPLWGTAPAPSVSRNRTWATTASRRPASPAPGTTTPAWKSTDLFSHSHPVQARPSLPSGAKRR
ncbi:winged helix-turn-helix transcriptional regulator [Actinacidiphila sp. bgisy144]|uniref:winged helix-turn-helix transcriptional regulator n=1 Tax=Actinacidiphila sp. bgisy144 TaxID=3413791 RepID=UPI003EBC9EF0